jgi:hypothetical protein
MITTRGHLILLLAAVSSSVLLALYWADIANWLLLLSHPKADGLITEHQHVKNLLFIAQGVLLLILLVFSFLRKGASMLIKVVVSMLVIGWVLFTVLHFVVAGVIS